MGALCGRSSPQSASAATAGIRLAAALLQRMVEALRDGAARQTPRQILEAMASW